MAKATNTTTTAPAAPAIDTPAGYATESGATPVENVPAGYGS